MQSVPTTDKVVSSPPARGELYSINIIVLTSTKVTSVLNRVHLKKPHKTVKSHFGTYLNFSVTNSDAFTERKYCQANSKKQMTFTDSVQ
jgi:hypothetical protein